MTNKNISKKKLKAIVFTDIVNFTKLSAENEQKALEIIDKQRDLLQPIVFKYKGEWLKEIGDGLLFSFDSSLEAVRCSIEIQNTLKEFDDLNIRIGIHQGDIFIKDGDVYGDDVNIASRVEGFSPKGGITISDKVYKDIQGVKEIKTSFIGHRKLKGVEQETKIRCITSNKLPKHRKQLLPLLIGYFAIIYGALIVLPKIFAIIIFYFNGGQVAGKEMFHILTGLSFIFIGYSNLSYVKGISIKSQKLLIYFSFLFIIATTLRHTLFDQFFFYQENIEDKVDGQYYYFNNGYRFPIDKAIEQGYIEKDSLSN